MDKNVISAITDAVAIFAGAAPVNATPMPNFEQYAEYLKSNRPPPEQLENQRQSLPIEEVKCPVISIAIVGAGAGDTDIDATLVSLTAQTYKKWELVLAFELSRTGVLRFKEMEHVRIVQLDGTLNSLLKAAEAELRGDIYLYLRPGDRLSPDSLFTMIQQFGSNTETDIIFADSDELDRDGNRIRPFFKPSYSPNSEMCYDMIKRPLLVKKAVHIEAGGYIGVSEEDYHEYALRCGHSARHTARVSRILLTQTRVPVINSLPSFENRLDTLLAKGKPIGKAMPGLFSGSTQIRHDIRGKASVALIISYPKNVEMLKRCLESIDAQITYPNYRLMIVASTAEETEADMNTYLEALKRNKAASIVRVKNSSISIPRLANEGAKRSASDYLMFISPHLEVLTPDFVERMIEPLQVSGVVACGGKLLDCNDLLYSCGTVIGLNGWAASPYCGTPDDSADVLKCTFTSMQRNVSALCGELFTVRSDEFYNIGLFDESFTHVGWDTELCIRFMRRGRLCVYTPYAKAKLNSLPIEYAHAPAQNLQRCYDAYREIMLAGDKYYNDNYDYKSIIPIPAINPYSPILLNPLYGKS